MADTMSWVLFGLAFGLVFVAIVGMVQAFRNDPLNGPPPWRKRQ